jgi:hypothetical protein
MKSKLEIRVFAIEQAVKVIGISTPVKDVVEKAKEIEAYIIGDAELPESYDNEGALMEKLCLGMRGVIGVQNVGE